MQKSTHLFIWRWFRQKAGAGIMSSLNVLPIGEDAKSISTQTCIYSLTKGQWLGFITNSDDAFKFSQLQLKCWNTMFIQWRVLLKSLSLSHTHTGTCTLDVSAHTRYWAHLCEKSYWSHSLLCDTIIINPSSKQSKFIQMLTNNYHLRTAWSVLSGVTFSTNSYI